LEFSVSLNSRNCNELRDRKEENGKPNAKRTGRHSVSHFRSWGFILLMILLIDVGITAIEIENADDRKHALSPFLPSPNGTFNGFFE
jgi:hypothetical protein